MKDEAGLERMRESLAMGHDWDFAWGREMVIERADDVPENSLRHLCNIGGADYNEVWLGMKYQRGIEQAAARLLAERGMA